MKLAIMQPYFFPYIGYFQLMNAVDEMVIYDNVEYTKGGWINRNRILLNGKDVFITIPLKNGSDYLTIKERYLADNWNKEKTKLLNKITEAYRQAPFFKNTIEIVADCLNYPSMNLFEFIFNSVEKIKFVLGIETPLIISSSIKIIKELKSELKVISICKSRRADVYINPIGGLELYKKDNFKRESIDLFFLSTTNIKYKQFDFEFVKYLSIIDVMMFNSLADIKSYLDYNYSLE